MGEDYGQDSEHLEVCFPQNTFFEFIAATFIAQYVLQLLPFLQELKSKFDEFRQNVRTGSERSVLCEEVANELLRRGTPYVRDVLSRQEKLRSAWSLLLEYIDARAHKLVAAGQLHSFNRRCADLHEKLTEKRVTLPTNYGRDAKQVAAMMHNHQIFRAEVNQMHGELQVCCLPSHRRRFLNGKQAFSNC